MTSEDRLDLSAQLQAAVAESGESLYRVAKRAGVSYAVVHRFMAGKRGVSLETAGQLAAALGLELSPSGKLTKPRQPPRVAEDLAARMLDRAFGGAVDRLLASALAHRPPTADEIAKLRAMLDEAGERKPPRRRPT